ncbi:hypothetical protein BN874_700002 [Candidatus Contendobacter odensis Run_B_J11]|uniref:Uncharacterized protein n=1 Tax=Candidatus Contendobacter odensis Run_B_J11 TaxID=1400861 RepID=A0A7U7GEW2_9GAMM|nr:hypothetical protein BN874_700002 [Candidatus Contendobacter odensis Run_B_J11]
MDTRFRGYDELTGLAEDEEKRREEKRREEKRREEKILAFTPLSNDAKGENFSF